VVAGGVEVTDGEEAEEEEEEEEGVEAVEDGDRCARWEDGVGADDAVVRPSAGSAPSWTRRARTPNTATTLASAPAANLRPLGARRLRTAGCSGMAGRIPARPQPSMKPSWELAERGPTRTPVGQQP
jgi:hypothetical protein